jgi:phenylacetate-CoA ligase
MPLIRYRTHDLSRLLGGVCSCGASTLKKFGNTARRRESIVKLDSGTEIYPSLFDDLLFTVPEIVDYQLNVGKEDGKDKLRFKIELIERSKTVQQRILQLLAGCPIIRKDISHNMMAAPEVELVKLGALIPMSRAKKMIMDKRQKANNKI